MLHWRLFFFFLRHYFKRRNVTKTITTVTLEGDAMWCLSKIFNYLQSCSQCSEKWGSGNLSNLPKFTKLDRIRVGNNSCLWLCLIRLLYKISCEETVLQKCWRTEEKRNSLAKQILTSPEYLRLRHVTSRHITSTTGVPHVTSYHVYHRRTSRHAYLCHLTSCLLQGYLTSRLFTSVYVYITSRHAWHLLYLHSSTYVVILT